MTFKWVTPMLAAVLLFAACDRGPTQPADTTLLDSLDPAALSFNATLGLPGQPFQDDNAMHASGDAKGPGAPFPDSLKLTASQKTAIEALVNAYAAASKADMAALKAIHDSVQAAINAGDTKAQVEAIARTAAPILERMRAASKALHDAIFALLTPAQQAWITAHKPAGPPPGFHPPVPHGP
jgi:Spy/CpxP family protein refolding chaperone